MVAGEFTISTYHFQRILLEQPNASSPRQNPKKNIENDEGETVTSPTVIKVLFLVL